VKHHYAQWSEDRSKASGIVRMALQPGYVHARCTRCGEPVIMTSGGTIKFWVRKDGVGKWTSRRPPCIEGSAW
jgi:hypothetical protein